MLLVSAAKPVDAGARLEKPRRDERGRRTSENPREKSKLVEVLRRFWYILFRPQHTFSVLFIEIIYAKNTRSGMYRFFQ